VEETKGEWVDLPKLKDLRIFANRATIKGGKKGTSKTRNSDQRVMLRRGAARGNLLVILSEGARERCF